MERTRWWMNPDEITSGIYVYSTLQSNVLYILGDFVEKELLWIFLF